jgi:uncharacterized protein
MFEWDEEKRLSTVKKHGIDFVDAAEIFSTEFLCLKARSDIEQRLIAVGMLQDIPIAVVFTKRDEVIRIITARRARKNEREYFQAHVARRNAENEESN